ncbi:MAG: TIGR04013 family B12-binding domain/radical SAM domain-containing protein [Candidatus Asgardarchaeia archaeon]
MKKNLCIIFHYSKLNKTSYNVLLGALEKWNILNEVDVFLLKPKDFLSKIKKLVELYEKVVVAFSFMTTQIFDVIEKVTYIRVKYPNVKLVAGGPHATGDPQGTLLLGFNVVVVGEGEETFPHLIKRFLNDESISKEKGLFLFDENFKKMIFTGQRKLIRLDDYPPFSLRFKRFNPIEITRGCPFGCFYCQTSFMFSKRVRHRSIENIAYYISFMNQHGLRDIRFISPNAFSYGSKDGLQPNYQKVEELLETTRQIIGHKGRIFFGSFPSEVRPEFVSDELVALVKRYANNDNLIIGAQTGSPRLLELINRGHTVEDIYKAVKITKKYGLIPNVDFIFGLPGETEQDIQLTLKVIRNLIKIGARIHAHTFLPLVGTPFSNKPPGMINKKLKKELGRLALEGKLYGEWGSQELDAFRINSYRILRKKLIQLYSSAGYHEKAILGILLD